MIRSATTIGSGDMIGMAQHHGDPTDNYAMQIRQGRSSFDKKRLYARYGARFVEGRPKSSVRRMLQTKWRLVCATEVHSYSTKPPRHCKQSSDRNDGNESLTSTSLPFGGCKIRIENFEAVLESARPRI